jgi:dipeptidyl aminopeptidase/acylaminoacyl peptidase
MVAYELQRPNIQANAYVTELWIARTDRVESPRIVVTSPPSAAPTSSFAVHWLPDSRSLSYIAQANGAAHLHRYFLDSRAIELVDKAFNQDLIDWRTVTADSYDWSPAGRQLAVAASPAAAGGQSTETPSLRGLTVDIRWPYDKQQPNARLWLLDVQTKRVDALTNGSFHVDDVAWSPDGRQIAFAQSADRRAYSHRSDIGVVEISSREVRQLVVQPGWDMSPVWSPDGSRIAFVTQQGHEDWNYSGWIGTVSSAGGLPTIVGKGLYDKTGSAPSKPWWDPAGTALYAPALSGLNRHLFRLDTRSQSITQVTPDGDMYYSHFSPAVDGRLAFGAETVGSQPTVLMSLRPSSIEAHRIVAVASSDRADDRPQTRRVRWRSRDGRFSLDGVLVTPTSAAGTRPPPLLVFLAGGPSMVRMGFNLDENVFPHLALVRQGYAVFAPNTRGRGGSGAEFRRAIPEAGNVFSGPYEDMEDGIDELVRQGAVDADRMGVMGFSYGAALATYALTKTHRFKVAIVDEGASNSVNIALAAAGDEDWMRLIADQKGFRSVWERGSLQNLVAQSPIFAFDRATTPTLLLYGEAGQARTEGIELLRGLRHFHVPSQLVVYPRTGHVIYEPRLLLDSFCRSNAWIDYWMNDQATESIVSFMDKRVAACESAVRPGTNSAISAQQAQVR